MKLRQIEYAVRLAETLSFREAADKCNAAQPTLSNGVAALEQELGGRLFERTTREVKLTALGRYVLPYLQAILTDQNELLQAVRSYKDPDHKLLRVGMSPLIDLRTLERALTPYRRQFPDVKILFKECLVNDLLERLLTDKLDIGLRVMDEAPTSLQAMHAYSERLFYLPQEIDGVAERMREWRLSNLPNSQIICTNGACGLNGALERLFRSQGVELELYPGFALSYHIIEEWTELGVGAAILPESKISSTNSTAGPLLCNNGEPATFHYEWVFRSITMSTTPPHICAFRDHIQKVAPALLKS